MLFGNPARKKQDTAYHAVSLDEHENENLPIEEDTSLGLYTPSVLLVCLIIFVGDSSRGILFPVLWNLCQSLNGNVVHLGYLVAMFSFGRFVITVPLGYFCDTYRHKSSLLIASTVLVIGATIWANAYAVKSLSMLFVGQFVMGCGSGSLGVTRSYIVEQIEQKERTKVLAVLTALQYAGFTASPLLGSYLSQFGARLSPYWIYALPSYFVGFLSLICCVGLLIWFQDIPIKDIPVFATGMYGTRFTKDYDHVFLGTRMRNDDDHEKDDQHGVSISHRSHPRGIIYPSHPRGIIYPSHPRGIIYPIAAASSTSNNGTVPITISTHSNPQHYTESLGDHSHGAMAATSSDVLMNGVGSASSASSVNSKLPVHTVRGYGSAGQSFSFDSAETNNKIVTVTSDAAASAISNGAFTTLSSSTLASSSFSPGRMNTKQPQPQHSRNSNGIASDHSKYEHHNHNNNTNDNDNSNNKNGSHNNGHTSTIGHDNRSFSHSSNDYSNGVIVNRFTSTSTGTGLSIGYTAIDRIDTSALLKDHSNFDSNNDHNIHHHNNDNDISDNDNGDPIPTRGMHRRHSTSSMGSVSLEEGEPAIQGIDIEHGAGGVGSVDNAANLQSLNESLKRSLLTAAESFDMIVVMICLAALNVTTKGGIAVYETLGTKIAISDYSMSSVNIGLLITLSGTVGFVQLLFYKYTWSKYFNDVSLMLGGILTMILAQLIFFSYQSPNPPQRWRFILCIILLYGFGYPIGYAAVLGAFAKVKKVGPQAALLGWFATAGSAARIVLPICSGYLESFNANGPYCLVVTLLSLSGISIIVLRKKIEYCIGDTTVGTQGGEKNPTLKLRQILYCMTLLILCVFSILYLFNPPY